MLTDCENVIKNVWCWFELVEKFVNQKMVQQEENWVAWTMAHLWSLLIKCIEWLQIKMIIFNFFVKNAQKGTAILALRNGYEYHTMSKVVLVWTNITSSLNNSNLLNWKSLTHWIFLYARVFQPSVQLKKSKVHFMFTPSISLYIVISSS